MKRLISLLCIPIMVCSVFVGCKSKDKNNPPPQLTPVGDAGNADILGFEASDHGGRVFSILVSTSNEKEYLTEERYTADVVNDTIFERNIKVQEYFGIDEDKWDKLIPIE